jgi:Protein of unknown function (DUF3617)
MTITHEGGRKLPPQTMQHCTDAATDKMMRDMGSSLAAGMCQTRDIRRVGGTYVVDATCHIGPMTLHSHSVISGDFGSAYTIRVTSKAEGGPPAARGMMGGTMVTQARWVGACKAGQKPGDIIMANGRTMNVRDLKNKLKNIARRPPHRPPPQ